MSFNLEKFNNFYGDTFVTSAAMYKREDTECLLLNMIEHIGKVTNVKNFRIILRMSKLLIHQSQMLFLILMFLCTALFLVLIFVSGKPGKNTIKLFFR